MVSSSQLHDKVILKIQRVLLFKLLELGLKLHAILDVIDATDSYFELVLRPSIRHDFPVVNAFIKADTAKDISEHIFILLDINLSVVRTNLEYLFVSASLVIED
jgi:hypothetical protein